MRIFETLKIGCSLGHRTNSWPRELRRLYDLRDAAVHHSLQLQPVVPHPSGLTHSGRENAEYCVEHATHGLDLANDVILTTVRTPREPLVSWAESMTAVPEMIAAWRKSLTAS
jgi:hypothetical protein